MDKKLDWVIPEVEQEELKWELLTWGSGDMYRSPFEIDGWTIAPVKHDDKPSIPKEAIERVEQLLNSGVKVQGFLIAHEVEVTKPEPMKVERSGTSDFPWVLLLCPLVLVAGFALAAACTSSDPVLIAVVEFESEPEPMWIEIWRWWE